MSEQNQVAKVEPKKAGLTFENMPDQIKLNFDKMSEYLSKVGITKERLISIAMNTLRDPKLTSCSPISLMGALMQSGQLGLLPNVFGEAYIIPYGGQAVFQIGYKGLVKLIYRYAQVEFLDANEVCENDLFDYELGERPFLRHKPAMTNRGEITHFYAVLRLKGDTVSKIRVLSKAEVDDVRSFLSKSAQGKAWSNFYAEMGKKTALVRLMKYYPLGEEMSSAVDADNSVREYDNGQLTTVSRAWDEPKEPEAIVDVASALSQATIIERKGVDAHEKPEAIPVAPGQMSIIEAAQANKGAK